MVVSVPGEVPVSPERGRQDRLGKEVRPDLATGRAEGSPQPDLAAPFEDHDDHGLATPMPPHEAGQPRRA